MESRREVRWTLGDGASVRPGLLAVIAALAIGGEAFGYRFFWRTANDAAVPVGSDALRWDPEVWGTGMGLKWVIADSPGWTESWETAARPKTLLSRAGKT